MLFGWQADYPGPATFYEPILGCRERHVASRENLNLSQFCDEQLDALVARAKATRGPAAVAAWAAAQRRLNRDAPVVPLVARRQILFVSAHAGNVRQSPFLGPLLEQMWVR